jgi:hypothetical protein
MGRSGVLAAYAAGKTESRPFVQVWRNPKADVGSGHFAPLQGAKRTLLNGITARKRPDRSPPAIAVWVPAAPRSRPKVERLLPDGKAVGRQSPQ